MFDVTADRKTFDRSMRCDSKAIAKARAQIRAAMGLRGSSKSSPVGEILLKHLVAQRDALAQTAQRMRWEAHKSVQPTLRAIAMGRINEEQRRRFPGIYRWSGKERFQA